QSLCPPMCCERLEKRVCSGVVALSRCTEDAGDRREQDECRQIQGLGELMQDRGTEDLGTHHPLHPRSREIGEEPVVEDTCEVEHGVERTLRRNLVQHPLDARSIRGVARDPSDRSCTEALELLHEVSSTGRIDPSARGEDEMAHAMLLHEVAHE